VETAVTAAAIVNTEENAEVVRISAGCMTDNRQKPRNKEDISRSGQYTWVKSHGLTANATKQIVHSQEVFVSVPSARDEFSGHPLAAEYAKRFTDSSRRVMRS
jgi:hypothetical protein